MPDANPASDTTISSGQTSRSAMASHAASAARDRCAGPLRVEQHKPPLGERAGQGRVGAATLEPGQAVIDGDNQSRPRVQRDSGDAVHAGLNHDGRRRRHHTGEEPRLILVQREVGRAGEARGVHARRIGGSPALRQRAHAELPEGSPHDTVTRRDDLVFPDAVRATLQCLDLAEAARLMPFMRVEHRDRVDDSEAARHLGVEDVAEPEAKPVPGQAAVEHRQEGFQRIAAEQRAGHLDEVDEADPVALRRGCCRLEADASQRIEGGLAHPEVEMLGEVEKARDVAGVRNKVVVRQPDMAVGREIDLSGQDQ